MRIRGYTIGWRCVQQGKVTKFDSQVDLHSFPVVFSDTDNKFIVVGCNTLAFIIEGRTQEKNMTSVGGCVAMCSAPSDVINGSCSGTGCCQSTIPKGLKSYQTKIDEKYMNESSSISNSNDVYSLNRCSYAFLAEESRFRFNAGDLSDANFYDAIKENVPVVLDWYIGESTTCREAQRNDGLRSYACQANTNCTDFVSGTSTGYLCSCLPGYRDNPYLSPGCTDIDECASLENNCSNQCINTNGNYKCSCPKEHHGDGLRSGSGCISNKSHVVLKIHLVAGFGVVISAIIISLIWLGLRRKKLMKQRDRFFERNGGTLLRQQLSPYNSCEMENKESFKIYGADELREITNNYSKDRILGKGGYGIVHKGILKDGKQVAVKTATHIDQTQIEQFINEVVILNQVNHRNVVKLKGCCLETEVPVLVYEYIPNGTLYEHINKVGGTYWLTWGNCIRLASEAADALSYLHSEASTPIIHRDIKSSNILIDDTFRAKISDFGASRLIPIGQTQVTTMILGTHGYLDPEYFQTSQLTEKSDVYSFGVLLTELLTKQPPLCLERKAEERNLATRFLRKMKEDRLSDILDPQLVSEASEDQLFYFAKLAKSCLNNCGEDRPTMKEVAVRLDGLKNQINHQWANDKYEESGRLLGQEDLYPVSSSDYDSISGHVSRQKDTLIEMSQQPR